MLKIAITDDEKIETDLLEKYVREWAHFNKNLVNIKSYDCAEAFYFEWEEDKSYDILLLDIQMQELDGIGLAKKIREVDQELKIIFITAVSDFIQEGYDVDAVNYLLKPVKKEKLFQCLDKANKKNLEKQNTILINTPDETRKVLLSDIIYIEADAHFLHIHTRLGEFIVRMSLNEIEAQLLKDEFVKTHRSFIVNIGHITSIQKEILKMDDNNEVPVSRRQYQLINQAFIKYNMKKD